MASATTGADGGSGHTSTSSASSAGKAAANTQDTVKIKKSPATGRHRASTQAPSPSIGTSAGKAKAVAAALADTTTVDTAASDTTVTVKVRSASAPPRATLSTPSNVSAAPNLSTALAQFVDGLNPLSGNGPTTPAGSVADLVLLAGTRREAALAAIPIYTIGVSDGVIGGCVVTGCTATPDGNKYTVIGAPNNGGKLSLNATTGKFTFLPFAPETNTNGPTGTETFRVLVAQITPFDTFVTGLPLIGSSIITPLIVQLQQAPIVSVILAPLIGSATTQTITADESVLRGPLDSPVAYTTKVTSWDGTKISTNFFPALQVDAASPTGYSVVAGTDSASILYGPGIASPGATDPTNEFVSTFRDGGYNVITWDPRGEFDSGGVLQLDSPQFEGQDVSKLISWVATQSGVLDDSQPTASTPGDPRLGMVGVSYGGGIQLVAAANDARIDAIAPGWSWNTLPASLYPDDAFRTAYSSLLLLGLITTGARINTQIYTGILTGAVLGFLSPSAVALLQSSGPGFTVSNITAPTLLISGTVDVLFPLEQSLINAGLLSEPAFVGDPTAITKVIWYCGGHGTCLPGQGDPTADDTWVMSQMLDWMNSYVKDDSTTPPEQVFEWSDQTGAHWTSTTLPTDPGFTAYTFASQGAGHLLPIIPVVGGSGPQNLVPLPYSLGDGSVATNAVNIQVTNPIAVGDDPINVVGAPTVTMTYSGIGTSQHVYAQVVDKNTGLVVGNLVTPLTVTLDGQTHTQTYQLNDIAYTMDANSDLEVQIVTSATPFLNLTQYGFINVGNVTVAMPVTTDGVLEPV
jgi:ABC-2 type transport system ATP-binding protein